MSEIETLFSALEVLGWMFPVGFGAVGGFLLITGVAALSQWVSLRGREPGTLHDAGGDGPVLLEGTAEPAGQTLDSPFTATDCLAYQYRIQEQRRDHDETGRTRHNWKTVGEGIESVPFLLSTETGTVYHDGDLMVDLGDGEQFTVGIGERPPEPAQAFVEARDDIPSAKYSPFDRFRNWSWKRRRRYREQLLEPGETAFVSGRAVDSRTVDGHVPDAATAVVRPADGGIPLLARHVGTPSVVADAPLAEFARRRRNFGLVALVLAGLFLAFAARFLGYW